MPRKKKTTKFPDSLGSNHFLVSANIVFFAFRYALGRKTGAVSLVVESLIRLWLDLSKSDRDQIKREIFNAIRQGKAGADCDIVQWMRILELDNAKGKPPWKGRE